MERLRVLTLNIWANHGPWPARAAAIRAGLRAEQPDVVALQEVLGQSQGGTQLDELLVPGEEFPADYYPGQAYGPACVLPGERTFGNALLSRFPIAAQRTLALPNPLGREPRSLLCCLLELPFARLPVFVTHLDWELDGSYARCQQVLFIAEQIELFVATAKAQPLAPKPEQPAKAVLPPILAGDFNAEPDSDEIRFLTGRHALRAADSQLPRGVYFNDCYARALARPIKETNPDSQDDGATFSRRNPFTAPAHEPDRRLDYIFAGLPDSRGRGQPLAAWRCFRDPYPAAGLGASGVLASDHYGVAVDLAMPKI